MKRRGSCASRTDDALSFHPLAGSSPIRTTMSQPSFTASVWRSLSDRSRVTSGHPLPERSKGRYDGHSQPDRDIEPHAANRVFASGCKRDLSLAQDRPTRYERPRDRSRHPRSAAQRASCAETAWCRALPSSRCTALPTLDLLVAICSAARVKLAFWATATNIAMSWIGGAERFIDNLKDTKVQGAHLLSIYGRAVTLFRKVGAGREHMSAFRAKILRFE